MKRSLTSFLIILCLEVVIGKLVTISNEEPKLDVNGKIVDAHDGSIQQFEEGGLYYYHGVEYGLCKEPTRYGCDQTADKCGFQLDHNISVWTSPDLSSGSWKFEGYAITAKNRPAGTVYRPHLVYNPNTKNYVLWWNYVTPQGQYNGYAVAVASDPKGPFTLSNVQVNVTRLKGGPGDFDLFVDDDGTGYVIYSSAFYMSIEQLTRDYVHSSGKTAVCGPNNSPLFPEYFVEAPVIFKRGRIYYALFGHCCCFCYQGSGIMVHTASSPLGPWVVQPGGNLACVPPSNTSFSKEGAEPTPGNGCLYQSNEVSTTRSQQNYVIQVNTPQGLQYIWTGDRWEQAPDGLKGHDPQYWVPLKFGSNGEIEKVTWVNQFTIDLV